MRRPASIWLTTNRAVPARVETSPVCVQQLPPITAINVQSRTYNRCISCASWMFVVRKRSSGGQYPYQPGLSSKGLISRNHFSCWKFESVCSNIRPDSRANISAPAPTKNVCIRIPYCIKRRATTLRLIRNTYKHIFSCSSSKIIDKETSLQLPPPLPSKCRRVQ